ncbi:MAG TPA: AAA family ATPase [Iamia sp.]|nr:AAA family ATPase [Iamia sp.]
MIADPGLEAAVTAFESALTPIVQTLAGTVTGVDPAALAADVTREAFTVAAAVIDCDGIRTDAELWSLLVVFGPRLGGDLLRATPDDLRRSDLILGRATWLDTPSTMLDLLARYDARHATAYARTYHDRAVAIAFAVAAIDPYTTEDELRAIERFRSSMARAGAVGGPETPQPGVPDPTSLAGHAAGDADVAALPPPRPIEELMAELDGLVGLKGVKAEVKLVADLIRVQNLRAERDLPVVDQSRHLVFAGNPGTGKTTVARLLAQIYRTLGVVERGHLVETDRSGLVAGFVGQTATKVVEVFDRADQGVVLIDEAYALVRGGGNDFGREAIDTIVKLVEDRRDRVVVIVAGYPDEMGDLIDANPGLRSRFPKTIVFDDYSTDDLLAIVASMGESSGYACDEEAEAKLRAWFDAQPRDKGFGNGRVARNLFEAAVARQASRVVAIEDPTDEDLTTLVAADIPDLGDAADSTIRPR